MLTLLGYRRRCYDRLARRDFLGVGALGCLSLSGLLRAQANGAERRSNTSVMLRPLFMARGWERLPIGTRKQFGATQALWKSHFRGLFDKYLATDCASCRPTA